MIVVCQGSMICQHISFDGHVSKDEIGSIRVECRQATGLIYLSGSIMSGDTLAIIGHVDFAKRVMERLDIGIG